MADITIGELPQASRFDRDSLLVAENQGIAESVSGAQIQDLAKAGAADAAAQAAAAASDANNAAKTAKDAANSILGLTAQANTLPPGSDASADVVAENGNLLLKVGIPRGDSGVYVGSGEMPDGYNIQIDPNGEASDPSDLNAQTYDLIIGLNVRNPNPFADNGEDPRDINNMSSEDISIEAGSVENVFQKLRAGQPVRVLLQAIYFYYGQVWTESVAEASNVVVRHNAPYPSQSSFSLCCVFFVRGYFDLFEVLVYIFAGSGSKSIRVNTVLLQ